MVNIVGRKRRLHDYRKKKAIEDAKREAQKKVEPWTAEASAKNSTKKLSAKTTPLKAMTPKLTP